MATTLTLILAAGGGCLVLAWLLGDRWRGGEASSSDGGGDVSDGEGGSDGGGGDGGGD